MPPLHDEELSMLYGILVLILLILLWSLVKDPEAVTITGKIAKFLTIWGF